MGESGRRRTHRKVRTGCITCKIRRVKCDEEKPTCRRCRSTGRKCDGYAFYPDTSFPAEESIGAYDGKIMIPMKVKPAAKYSSLEIRGLEYFQINTVKALESFVETEVWSRLLLQLSETEPSIKHAMIAFSAYHELAATHGFDAVSRNTTNADEFALKEYNVAIGQLWRHLSSGKASKTVALVSCLLFICLEFVRGDRDTAITHLRNGMSILRLQPDESLDSMPSDIEWSTADDSLAPVFARLSIVQTVMGQPRESRYMDFLTLPASEPMGYFLSMDEARAAMVNFVNAAHSFSYMTDNFCFPTDEAMHAAQASIVAQLDAFLAAFAPFCDKDARPDVRGAIMMKCTVLLCKLWTQRATSHLETDFDAYTPQFAEIVDLLEEVLDEPAGAVSPASSTAKHEHTFTVDTGVLSNLFFTAIKCRDRALRRRAIALMSRAPRREGLWDAVEITKMCEMLVRVEEEGVPEDELPPESARVHDFDIRARDPLTQRQMVLLSRKRFNTPKDMDVMRVEYLLYDE